MMFGKMATERATCPKCGEVVGITSLGKFYRHAAAKGAYRICGMNICPNSGKTARLESAITRSITGSTPDFAATYPSKPQPTNLTGNEE